MRTFFKVCGNLSMFLAGAFWGEYIFDRSPYLLFAASAFCLSYFLASSMENKIAKAEMVEMIEKAKATGAIEALTLAAKTLSEMTDKAVGKMRKEEATDGE